MSRDDQFAGFAKLLACDIRDRIRQLYAEFGLKPDSLVDLNIHKIEPLIAQRAYDFACHVATHTLTTAHGDMGKIPDMTTWPEEAGER